MTSNPHDRAEGRIKEFSFGHPKTSGTGMERSTFPLGWAGEEQDQG